MQARSSKYRKCLRELLSLQDSLNEQRHPGDVGHTIWYTRSSCKQNMAPHDEPSLPKFAMDREMDKMLEVCLQHRCFVSHYRQPLQTDNRWVCCIFERNIFPRKLLQNRFLWRKKWLVRPVITTLHTAIVSFHVRKRPPLFAATCTHRFGADMSASPSTVGDSRTPGHPKIELGTATWKTQQWGETQAIGWSLRSERPKTRTYRCVKWGETWQKGG